MSLHDYHVHEAAVSIAIARANCRYNHPSLPSIHNRQKSLKLHSQQQLFYLLLVATNRLRCLFKPLSPGSPVFDLIPQTLPKRIHSIQMSAFV